MSISFAVGNRRVRFAGKTDVGKVRAHNEDDLFIPSDMAVAAISDGMGGHACGEVASRITVETIERYYRSSSSVEAPTWPFRLPQIEVERNRMTTAIKLANSEIFDQAAADPDKKGMGCTVDAIYFAQGRLYIGHVGDSRAYRFRAGQLTQLTEDHSLLNDYRRIKEMAEAEIEAFPHKNVVVRALGLAEHVAVDVIVDEYHLDDIFLLCSDGLTDLIDDAEICDIIEKRGKRLDGACDALVDAANEAGGRDNITAVLIQILEG